MRKRILQGALLLLVAGGLLWAWPLLQPAFSGSIVAAADLLGRTGAWGPFLVIGLQVLQAIISPLPSWPVTVAAGALYGPVPATLYALVGGTAGAAVNWVLARRWGRPWVQKRLPAPWLARVDHLGPLHFLLLSLLGRLIPVASFDMVAYLAGLSSLRLLPFLAVATVGQAPALFAYAWFGADLAGAQTASLLSSLILLLFVGLSVLAKRWLKL